MVREAMFRGEKPFESTVQFALVTGCCFFSRKRST